jgi:peptide deformylase
LVEVGEEQNYVIINPEVIKSSKEWLVAQEGCLSLPGWYGDVPRPAWVTVEFTDLDGKRQRLRRADGLLGRALQHEIDHLNGILFTERMTDLSTLKDLREEETAE